MVTGNNNCFCRNMMLFKKYNNYFYNYTKILNHDITLHITGGFNMARKSLAIGIIILFLFCNVSFTTLSDENNGNLSGKTLNKVIYVDDDNVEGPWYGNIQFPFKNIQDGIDNAYDGDTIFVYNGNYFENIIVNKSIFLRGQDNRYSVIKVNNSKLIRLYTDDIEISNFKIEGLSNSYAFQVINSSYCHLHHNLLHTKYGIYVENCNYTTLDNNTITETVFIAFGIKVYFSKQTLIENNTFDYNNGDWGSGGTGGIYLHDSPYGKLINNWIYNIGHISFLQRQMDGIYLCKSPYCIVADNYIENGSTGIICWYSSDSIISGNHVSESGLWGIDVDIVENSIFYKNTILSCRYGFSIYDSKNNLFTGNIIDDNDIGFDIRFSENNSIIKNSMSRNYAGLDVISSNDNKIRKNNFIFNVIDASIGTCENDWDNNYWNRPRIMPKIIFLSFRDFIRNPKIYFDIDWHPAKEPYDISFPEVDFQV